VGINFTIRTKSLPMTHLENNIYFPPGSHHMAPIQTQNKTNKNYESCPVSFVGRALDCEWDHMIPRWCRLLSLWLMMKSFQQSFALYLCSGSYKSGLKIIKLFLRVLSQISGISWSLNILWQFLTNQIPEIWVRA
jgi:hypothetical protein